MIEQLRKEVKDIVSYVKNNKLSNEELNKQYLKVKAIELKITNLKLENINNNLNLLQLKLNNA